jgi:hypothetical protein
VTLAVPGVVDTGYFEATANVRDRLPDPPRAVEPARVGEATAAAVAAGDGYVVEPPETRLLVGGSRVAPGLLRRMGRQWRPE